MKTFNGSGLNGFIGSALKDKLLNSGFKMVEPTKADFYFHFGSPSSNILFEENLNDCIQDTVKDFLSICEMCRDNHVKLIYPSSATVYEADNPYAHTKRALESIQNAYDFPILRLRIFAGYGVGEDHKRSYASIVNQFINQMLNGERPVIFGDGNQTRDFVYIDDIVKKITDNLYSTGSIDIGTGINTSFNIVVKIINQQLRTDLEPIYVGEPKNYLKDTACNNPLPEFTPIEDGIDMMLSTKLC